jgi:hypothetical protein
MGKKGKGSKKKKDDEKKKKKKKKKDDTHTSKEPSVTVSNPPTAVPMKWCCIWLLGLSSKG